MDTNRRILITGAASRLGLALTRALTARGNRVLATGLADSLKLVELARVDYLQLDVRRDENWNRASYNAVKAGVVAISETLRHELAPYGVTCSVVCPSFFRANRASSLHGSDVEAEKMAATLINSSKMSARAIAAVAQAVTAAGIDDAKPVILTDRAGRTAYWMKRLRPPLDNRTMATFAQKSFERAEEGVSR